MPCRQHSVQPKAPNLLYTGPGLSLSFSFFLFLRSHPRPVSDGVSREGFCLNRNCLRRFHFRLYCLRFRLRYLRSLRRHCPYRYYSLDYLHPKSPFLPRLVESTDVSSQAENPSPSLHLRFLCYHTFVTRLKKQEPQPSKVKLLPSSIRGLRRFSSYLHHWKQRLLSCGIPLCPLKELVSLCFSSCCRPDALRVCCPFDKRHEG